MSEMVRTEDVLGGEPRLDGHRISVVQIADMVFEGDHSAEDVADQLDVSLADVRAALAYYDDNPDEMAEIRQRHRELEAELAAASSAPGTAEQ